MEWTMKTHWWRAAIVAAAFSVTSCGTGSAGTPAPEVQTPETPPSSRAAVFRPASHDQVEKFRALWNSTDLAIGSLLVPNTPAYAYTESSLLTSIDRKVKLPQLTWSGAAITDSVRVTLSEFQVDTKGRITDFRRNDQPIAEQVQPGDRKTYRTPDHQVEMRVLAFRRFNIDGGNLSTVFTVTDHGGKPATLVIPKLRAAGHDMPLSDTSLSIPGGATITEPLSEGPDQLPDDVTLTVILNGKTSKSLAIPVPAFG
jgi:hypothetical protein